MTTVIDKQQAMEVFDGLMLGDAGLPKREWSASFKMDLSAGHPDKWRGVPEENIPQIKYLQHIKEFLEPLGLRFCAGYPKVDKRLGINSSGRLYLRCRLISLVSDFLLAQHCRWYHPVTEEIRRARRFAANRKWYKVLPKDVRLTPLTIAKWFEGDGTTGWSSNEHYVSLHLCTNGFAREEVERLSSLFMPFYVRAKACQYFGNYWTVYIGGVDNINTFFDLIGELVHECYGYKVKRPKYAVQSRQILFEDSQMRLRAMLQGGLYIG